MRLTNVLLRYIRKNPRGNIWNGKHRLAHHAFDHNIENMTRRLKMEEQNLFFLRHPYITISQEEKFEATPYAHQLKAAKEKAKQREEVISKLEPSKRMEEHLNSLTSNENWETYK